MKALVLSGGASKGAFTAGVVKYLLREQGMDFDMAIGTSTGSLVAGPALLKEYDYLGNVYTSVHDDNILKNSPFVQFLNLLKKIGPIDASMEPLAKLLRKYYLEDRKLDKIIQQGKECIATIVNVHTGEIVYVSSNQVSNNQIKRETFVKAIVASCSEPVFTEPQQVFKDEAASPYKDDLFYDGGVKEFLPFYHAIQTVGADDVWAVSTHLLSFEETGWGRGTSPKDVNILKALGWTISSTLNEVERGDLFRAYAFQRQGWVKKEIKKIADQINLPAADTNKFLDVCDKMFKNAKTLDQLRVIRPHKAMKTSLEFDPAIMANYFVDGELAAEKFIREGSPLFTDTDWIMPQYA